VTDEQWEKVAEPFPSNAGKEGRPFADHRSMPNACF